MTRRLILGLSGAAVVALIVPNVQRDRKPRLVWNATASAPVGLYAVRPGASIAVGDMVVARVPARFRSLAAARHYLPANVPLVKQVAAGPGDQICALGPILYRNGVWLAERRRRDGQRRPLPAWQGCVRLGAGQFFLLMAANPLSFDGRYFGANDRRDLIGKAHLLWAR